jgi:hypothetical protein
MLALAAIGASGGSPLGFAFIVLGGTGAIATTAPVRRRARVNAEPSEVDSQPERCA